MRRKHPYKRWEVSIASLADESGVLWKVTRQIPDLTVAETKMFRSKAAALRQFNAWLE